MNKCVGLNKSQKSLSNCFRGLETLKKSSFDGTFRRQNVFRLKCHSTKNRGFSSITLGYLTDVSLKLCCVVFNDYEPVITDFSR